MVPAGGSRDGVGDEGGAGVENRLLRAVKGEVKLAKMLLEGVKVLSPPTAGDEDGDFGAGEATTSGTESTGLGDLAASWTCRRRAIADSSPVMKAAFGGSGCSTLKESNSEVGGLALITVEAFGHSTYSW